MAQIGSFNVVLLTQTGASQPLQTGPIDFGAAPNTAGEILQNVKMILTTPIFSVPFDRKFGIDYSFLDQPLNIAKARLAAEVFQKIAKYEPRCRLVRIDFDGDAINGVLTPTAVVQINLSSGKPVTRTLLPSGVSMPVIDVSWGSAVVTTLTVSS